MARKNWHIIRSGGELTLARRLPVRFDVAAQTTLPIAGKLRIAQQIRQDLWRLLRHVRGFCPVVRVEEDGTHLLVRAGGEIHARTFSKQHIEAKIAGLLESAPHRARWVKHSERRSD